MRRHAVRTRSCGYDDLGDAFAKFHSLVFSASISPCRLVESTAGEDGGGARPGGLRSRVDDARRPGVRPRATPSGPARVAGDIAARAGGGLIRLISEENSGLAKVVPMDAVIELTSLLARVMDESIASGQQTISWQAFADAVGAARDNAASLGQSTADPAGGTE